MTQFDRVFNYRHNGVPLRFCSRKDVEYVLEVAETRKVTYRTERLRAFLYALDKGFVPVSKMTGLKAGYYALREAWRKVQSVVASERARQSKGVTLFIPEDYARPKGKVSYSYAIYVGRRHVRTCVNYPLVQAFQDGFKLARDMSIGKDEWPVCRIHNVHRETVKS